MIIKCSNHVAFGEIDEPTLTKLLASHAKALNAKELIDGKYDAQRSRR